MLEIKHISKTYRPKKGVPVTALDDVSLSFGDRGLVFILGKSGSGKSTLLNLIGGLDQADSGEFIIEGKSSKDFKKGDFDSYRNTFIGFIFQEYNILNEFNVGANVALALELQGKKATTERINEILRDVDLEGYGGRRPNELSGGQKQRVAIARALVKDPRIIMADEPTGALDSNTGKQVFDTLKKLSKDKLVLVVSHDREFAEFYGDRVIELADGKVVSDILKYQAQAERESEGVSIVDGKILRIEEGYELTEKDLSFINAYLKEHKGETIISSDERANSGLKRAAMIDEKGAKESFRETSEASEEELNIKSYDGSKTQFVRSRMPFKKAFKMGASSLKTKPVRLFFTILLSFIALAMFGLADTLAAYNKVDNTALSIRDNRVSTAWFQKNTYNNNAMTDDEILKLKNESGVDFKGVLKLSTGYYEVSKPNVSSPSALGRVTLYGSENYYSSDVTGMYELSESDLTKYGAELIAGELPTKDNEIAITKYIFDCYNKAGYIGSENNINIKKGELTLDSGANGILGKTLTFGQDSHVQNPLMGNYIVTGVVDTKISEKYDQLKEDSGNDSFGKYDEEKARLRNEFGAEILSGIHNLLFVRSGFNADKIALIKAENATYPGYIFFNNSIEIRSGHAGWTTNHILKLGQIPAENAVWLDKPLSTLNQTQTLLSTELLDSLLSDAFRTGEFSESYTYYDYNGAITTLDCRSFDDYRNYASRAAVYRVIQNSGVPSKFKEDYQSYIDSHGNYQRLSVEAAYTNFVSNGLYDGQEIHSGYYVNPYGDSGLKMMTEEFVLLAKKREILEDVFGNLKLDPTYNYSEGKAQEVYKALEVVGFYAEDRSIFPQNLNVYSSIVVSDEYYSEYAQEPGYYLAAIAPMPDSASVVHKLSEIHYSNLEHNKGAVMANRVIAAFDNVNYLIEMLSSVFLYIGIGLAVFSAFLLSNFIAVSISNKKHEIGILRAVGAKSSDVFMIFFNESMLIALINYVLALIGTIVGCVVLNGVFAKQLTISLLNFGIRQIGLMLGISILVAAIASFLPVWFIARKRPIDAIRGR